MKAIYCIVCCALIISSCGAAKKTTSLETVREERTNLAGETVIAAAIQFQGIDMGKGLSEDGTKIIEIPFRWYMGIGTADLKQVAVEIAQREAYATISRTLSNMVDDNAKRGNLVNNGKVEQALSSYWEQVSISIQKGCEPYGEVVIEYNPADRMYTAHAKVGIRGDKYNKLLDNATDFGTDSLTEEERKQFIETNRAILEAAKGL